MSAVFLWTLLALFASMPQAQGAQVAEGGQEVEKLDLSAAFVGDVDAARGKEFLELLGANLREVKGLRRSDLKTPEVAVAALAAMDVVVVDQDLTGLLPAGYAKPMLLISGPGVKTAESLGAKLDWL
jgi:hypothetical protein